MKLFDIKNNNVVLNEHVLTIPVLKKLYQKKDGQKYIAYCMYMTCPYEDQNPFANIPHSIKDEKIKKYLEINNIPNDYKNDINTIMELLKDVYETPIVRLFNAVKNKVDDIAQYLETTKITDKNIKDIRDTIKTYKDIVEPYKAALREVMSERESSKAKGNQNVAYDQ